MRQKLSYAVYGNRVLSVGMEARPMIGGPHYHTNLGPIAESILRPLSAQSYDDALAEARALGYRIIED